VSTSRVAVAPRHGSRGSLIQGCRTQRPNRIHWVPPAERRPARRGSRRAGPHRTAAQHRRARGAVFRILAQRGKYEAEFRKLITDGGTKLGIVEKFRLDGRVTVVTGASSGLGVAFARGFAQAGSDVVLAARRVNKLQQTAEMISDTGREPLVIATDIADPAQAQRMVDAAISRFGRVDVLINNAGIGTARPAVRETPEEFREVIEINLNGAYWAAQACGRVMQPRSAIINISSILGLTTAGLPQAAYSASKAAIMGLTRDLAQQVGIA